jgi:hypothetical protein
MGDNVRRALTVCVGVVAITGIVGWRSLGGTLPSRARGAAPVARPDYAQLMAYIAPLSDSAIVLPASPERLAARRDPFIAAVSVAERLTVGEPAVATVPVMRLRVTATLLAGARRAAVINDSLVYVGDAIPGGGRLESVERDRVVVTDAKGVSRTVAVVEGEL